MTNKSKNTQNMPTPLPAADVNRTPAAPSKKYETSGDIGKAAATAPSIGKGK